MFQNMRRRCYGVGMWTIIGLALFQIQNAAAHSDKDDNRPQRQITMAAEFPGIEIPLGEDVKMDIFFHNQGRSDETVNVWIAGKPEGWTAKLKTYRFIVTGVHVPSGENKVINFEAQPPKDVSPGKYEFQLQGKTADGHLTMDQTISVTLKEKEEGTKESKGVKLTTSYPVLQGPSDAKFEFSIEVESKIDKDAVFDLAAEGPQGWDINFKPAYETKFISSLRLKANQNTSVGVEVKPSPSAKAGEYPVTVRVSSTDANAEAKLNVVLTGTYELEVGTPSGLLSLDAKQGMPANMSFYVKNTGSAANNGIKFMSFKPENWKVEFKPEKIDTLQPGEFKQVEIVITPYQDALVGDYSVSAKIQGEKAEKSLEFRVTVKASSVWAWIGIGIIVLVVGGLSVLFHYLGRR